MRPKSLSRKAFIKGGVVFVPTLLLARKTSAQGLTLADPAYAGSLSKALPQSYVAKAVDFDGTNDFMRKTDEFTGIVDGKKTILSFWFKLNGGDAAQLMLYSNQALNYVERTTSNTFRLRANDTLGNNKLDISTVATYTAGSGWHHFLAAWDMATAGARYIYVDDVADLSVTNFVDAVLDYTGINETVGALYNNAIKWNGCISECYLNRSEYLDISVESNRRKFISSGLKPVLLGSTGSAPTGTAPILYLKGDETNFNINSGTGGNLAITGALTACSNAP